MAEFPLAPPFRAEIIGSFLRPPELLKARTDCETGRISAEQLRAAEDQAIREVVGMQERVGLKAVTDGEYRRGSYSDFTVSGLTGVVNEAVGGGAWAYTNAAGHSQLGRIPRVEAPIRWRPSTSVRDFTFLRSITKAIPKLTIAGPCYIHFRAGRERIDRDVYPDLRDFWSDLIAAYHAELKALGEAGCRYLQMDETSLAKFGDPKLRDALAARGDDWQELLAQYIEVINAVVAGAPAGMRIGIHLCRGNARGHWQAAGGYGAVAPRLFRDLKIGFFFLEYDSERAGSFTPLKMVPEDKVIVLGLVSTKAAELESAESLVARIREAAKFVPLERLALSPQCGFSSGALGNEITIEQQAAKLRRVVEVTAKVWSD